MKNHSQLIETLSNSPVFRDYEHAYSNATGLPLALRPVETVQVALRGQRNENKFCALMTKKSPTCAACLQAQDQLTRSAMNRPATATCAYGLCELAVPVKLGGQTVGFLQTGQVLRDRPTAETIDHAMNKVSELEGSLNLDTVRAAYLQTPVLSLKRMESVSNLLSIFAEHLSMKSNQIAMQQANAEPPVIVHAKRFIHDHITEDLSLGQVAKTAHMSIFYFCKLFRKVTGMTFTEFVARTRIEKAKDLLLNPHLRISEIAFESGFQSLTHFNRVFKAVVGESPSAHRAQISSRL